MTNNPANKTDKVKKRKSYSKYAGLPSQLLGLIAVFGFVGYKLDQHYNNSQYYITAALTILAFSLFMFKLFVMIKDDK